MTEEEKEVAKKMPPIDIVMTHKNRLGYLKRTLDALWKRTKSRYTLSIIDDGSDDGSREYLLKLFEEDKLKNVFLKSESSGYFPAINSIVATATSPFFVFMTDDTILPDVEPDWLFRLWREFDWCIELGILGLCNPTALVQPVDMAERVECIQFVKQINSNVIMFRDRPEIGYGDIPFKALPAEGHAEMIPFSLNCTQSGHKIGYLHDTYSLHIGVKSAMRGLYLNDEYDPHTFVKVDPKTLKPLGGI